MKIVSLFVFIFLSFQLQAAEKVEFVANNVHSLIVFIDAIAGSPHQPEHLKLIFNKSAYNTTVSAKMIKQYQDLDPVFNRYIEFKDVPSDRNNGINVRSLILIQSAFAKDVDDFQNRVMSFMQFDEMTRFREVLEYFYPIHEVLLWKPYHKDLEAKAAFFEQKSKIWKLDEMFSKAKKFYNSPWPESQKFRISLFPIPPEAKHSTASSYGPFESVGIIIGEKDDESRFGVIFHELCHSLYAAQSIDFQKQMSKWFQENKSPYGKLTQLWVNEVLATILGNGWAYFRIKGEVDKSQWYNDPTIETLSKALYPEAIKYLDAGKSIDKKFVDSIIETFQKNFPNSIRELKSLLADLILLTDGSFGSSKSFSQLLRKTYKIRSLNSSSPINHTESLEVIKQNAQSTVFIVASWKGVKQFDSLKSEYSFITDQIANAPQNHGIFGVFDKEGRKFIISVLPEGQGYDFLYNKIKGLQKIEKLNEFVDLDTM